MQVNTGFSGKIKAVEKGTCDANSDLTNSTFEVSNMGRISLPDSLSTNNHGRFHKGVLCRQKHDAGDGTSWRSASGHCVECRKSAMARSKAKRKSVDRELARVWRAANKEHLAAKSREYRANHPDRVRGYESRRTRPPERRTAFNTYRRQYARNNPEKTQAAYQRRRAALSTNNTLTGAEIASQRHLQMGLCFYCWQILDNNGQGHIDHLIPLIRGGFNEACNIVIACSQCNLRKGKATADEFLRRRYEISFPVWADLTLKALWPGATYGISKDVWSALAVAATFDNAHRGEV